MFISARRMRAGQKRARAYMRSLSRSRFRSRSRSRARAVRVVASRFRRAYYRRKQMYAARRFFYSGKGTPAAILGDVRSTGFAPRVTVCHEEYIKDIFSSREWQSVFSDTEGSLLGMNINPTNTVLFPWLSQIAIAFQQYKFKYLEFIYTTTSVDALNSTNTALGTVSMGVEYNLLSNAPKSKPQLENLDGAMVGKPSRSFVFRVNVRPSTLVLDDLYTEISDASEPGVDNRFSVLGRFYCFTQGSQQSDAERANWGELRVRYCCELLKPILAVTGGDFGSEASLVASAGTKPETLDIFAAQTGPNLWYQPTFTATGIANNAPLGQYVAIMNQTFTEKTQNNAPVEFRSTDPTAAGYDSIYVPPRADGEPWNLAICLQWVGAYFEAAGLLSLAVLPDPVVTSSVKNLRLTNANFVGACFNQQVPANRTEIYGNNPAMQIGYCQDPPKPVIYDVGDPGGDQLPPAKITLEANIRSIDPSQGVLIQPPFNGTLPPTASSIYPVNATDPLTPVSGAVPNVLQICLDEVSDTFNWIANVTGLAPATGG